MQDPETRTVFACVDGRSDAQVPNRYAEQKPVDDPDVVRGRDPRPAANRRDDGSLSESYSDEWIETERFNAVVEPSRLRKQAGGDENIEPLFHVPPDSYPIINPVGVYGPLEGVLRETEN